MMRGYAGRHWGWIAVAACLWLAPGCGDDDGPAADAGTEIDGGAGPTDAGGVDAGGSGSTVGMVCANDDHCTGAGEICCLERAPYVCALAVDCMPTSGGVPCERRADCPSSRVCCRLPTDQFCTTRNACADFGGDEVP